MKIKLLIADVDGTLVTPIKALTARTCEAVARLRAAGVGFTITSGRPPRGLAKLVAPLGLTAPMAAFNGGMYVKPDLTVVARHIIAPPVAREAVETMLRAGLDVWVYRDADWFVRRADGPRVARERGNVGFDPIAIESLYGVLDGAIKIVGVSEDRPLVARCEAELVARLGAEASAARSQPYYLDVTHPEANKGMVVREAARLLRIPIEQIATIGDMANDLPMLGIAGLSIAMGNAPPEVQRVARHITRSNGDEGFAHAVDSFILGEPPLARTALGLPPRSRACLFDLEGVLAQTAALDAEAWKVMFDHYLRERARTSGQTFVPFDPVRDYNRHFSTKPSPEDVTSDIRSGVRSFLDSRDIELPVAILQALTERHGQILVEVLGRERAETYEGSVRYVRAARAAGLQTAVVSSGTHCEETLRSAGIADLFDVWVDAAEHFGGSPAPDSYLAAAQALGVECEEAVVFADDMVGVDAGRAGHFGYVVAVDRQDHARELRRHGADVVVTDLGMLIEPDVGAHAGYEAMDAGMHPSP